MLEKQNFDKNNLFKDSQGRIHYINMTAAYSKNDVDILCKHHLGEMATPTQVGLGGLSQVAKGFNQDKPLFVPILYNQHYTLLILYQYAGEIRANFCDSLPGTETENFKTTASKVRSILPNHIHFTVNNRIVKKQNIEESASNSCGSNIVRIARGIKNTLEQIKGIIDDDILDVVCNLETQTVEFERYFRILDFKTLLDLRTRDNRSTLGDGLAIENLHLVASLLPTFRSIVTILPNSFDNFVIDPVQEKMFLSTLNHSEPVYIQSIKDAFATLRGKDRSAKDIAMLVINEAAEKKFEEIIKQHIPTCTGKQREVLWNLRTADTGFLDLLMATQEMQGALKSDIMRIASMSTSSSSAPVVHKPIEQPIASVSASSSSAPSATKAAVAEVAQPTSSVSTAISPAKPLVAENLLNKSKHINKESWCDYISRGGFITDCFTKRFKPTNEDKADKQR